MAKQSPQLSFEDARPRARKGPGLVVLPDASRVEDRLARQSEQTPLVAGRAACTLAELERELVRAARQARACPPPLPPHALRLLMRELAREHTPRTSPFFAIRALPGYAQAAADLQAALTQGLLEPKELLALCPNLPPASRERVEPLAALLLRVRAELDRLGLAEPHRQLALAVEALESGLALPSLLAGKGLIEFDGILDWTPLRLRLASVLAGRLAASRGAVRVRLPWSPGRPELTEALDPVLRAFEAQGHAGGHGVEVAFFDPGEGSPLSGFLAGLFSPQERTQPARVPVKLRACASPRAQAAEVARLCKDLAASGTPPDAIAVAARSLGGGVGEELAAALDRVGVPWRERRGRPALPAPPVRLALRILDMAERGYPRADLEEILSSRLLWLREGSERASAQALVRRLREAHVRDDLSEGEGGGAVSLRLAALGARIEARARLRGEDAAWAVAEVAETRSRAQRVIDAVRALPERATLRDHAAALLALLDRWSLSRRLRRGATEGDEGPDGAPAALARAAEGALARDQAALRALEECCKGLVHAAAALGRAELQVARAEWAQLLMGALGEASLPPGGARGGAVQLVELRELPGRAVPHLFVAGLVDGELPARPSPDPLLSDDDRRAINRASMRAVFRALPAPSGEDAVLALPPRQAEEPLLFHLALCAAQRSLSLLWPRADDKGREVLRSPFVDEAVRALGLSPAEEAACSVPLSPVPAAHDCRTPGDLLARAALEAFAEPAWRVSKPMDESAAAALGFALSRSPLSARLARASRAALAERERVRAFVREIGPGRFSGRIEGPALEAVLPTLAFGATAPLSGSQLEENATCSFRTFGHRLLHIQEEEEGADDLDHKDRGKLLHRCLEAFFVRLRDDGRLPLRGSEDDLQLLREVAAAEMRSFAAEEHVGHRALWELRQREVLGTLEALIRSEASQSSKPLHFERRFGYAEEGSWQPLRIPSPDGKDEVLVRGAIDRVDELADGTLLILDYKSGDKPKLNRKLRGQTLLEPEYQLPLYIAAVRAQFGEDRVDAGYVSLKEGVRSQLLGSSVRKEGIDLGALVALDPGHRELLRRTEPPPLNLADSVWKRVSDMRQGLFRVAPIHCDFCDLKPVCRLVALPTDPEENGGEVTRG